MMTFHIRRRLADLERRPVAWTEEQWARLTLDELEQLAALPSEHDGRWAFALWSDEHRAFAEAMRRKAEGIEA